MAYYYLGKMLELKGHIDEAIEKYREVLAAHPEWKGFFDKLARLLATYNESKYYNPSQAVSLAKVACEHINYRYPEPLDTLAIAYASDGKFPLAIETAAKAIKLAESTGKNDLAVEIRSRLELYRAGKAYHKALPEKL